MKIYLQWQKVEWKTPSGLHRKAMMDQITIDQSMPVLKISNARLAKVEMPSDCMIILFRDADFKGPSVKVYADEVITGIDRIGSVVLKRKSHSDYELVQLQIADDERDVYRMLPPGVYQYAEIISNLRYNSDQIAHITVLDPAYQIEHFQRCFRIKRTTDTFAAVLQSESQTISITGKDSVQVDLSDGVSVQLNIPKSVLVITPVDPSLQQFVILESSQIQPMGIVATIRTRPANFQERLFKNHLGFAVISPRDAVILLMLLISMAVLVTMKLSSSYRGKGQKKETPEALE